MYRRIALALLLAACGSSGKGGTGGSGGASAPSLTCEPVSIDATFGRVTAGTAHCTARGTLHLASAHLESGSVSLDVPERTLAGEAIDLAVTVAYPPLGTSSAAVALTFDGGSAALSLTVNAAPPGWDPDFVAPTCRADGAAPLLDQVLTVAGLTRDTFGPVSLDLAQSDYQQAGVLDDAARLSWFPALRGHPARAGCFEGQVAGGLDAALAGPHPVASMIRQAAALLDRIPDTAGPLDAGGIDTDYEAALAKACKGPLGPCGQVQGAMPADLGRALAPILSAISLGVAERHALDGTPSAGFWRNNGGAFTMNGFQQVDITKASNAAYLLGQNRGRLYRAAAQIAFAVQQTDFAPFRGRMGVSYDLPTGAGVIRVRDGKDDVYPDADEDVLLLVDLGGNDRHLDEVASNHSGANAVSVAIDLAGDDFYGYDEVATPYDKPQLLPADADGRAAPDGMYGPYSLSHRFRQGAGRNGIALLFDLGGGNDVYRSLRGSQGYAHLGVGVLFDDGGDDHYLGESNVQGSGQFGIGLLIDAGAGNDEHRSFTNSQGFGYVTGAGFLVDGGGNDTYFCDHGDPDRGGLTVYYSPQTTTTGNSSFCQGAGFGMRADPTVYYSGGIGVLRDQGGDDQYDASVFAQGVGYWQGTGLLSDGGGADRYDAAWYVQGAAAHYSVGLLFDSGPGDDVFDGQKATYNMSLGSGHDYSTGVLVNEQGNDTYHVGTLAVGSSNCNGSGLFVDNDGDDHYLATSDYNEGMGNISDECRTTRPTARSMGIFIDAGGNDDYQSPATTFPRPANDTSYAYRRSDHPGERGAGLDGTGESGVHAESSAVTR